MWKQNLSDKATDRGIWAQVITACLGIFLMAAPGVFDLRQPAADQFHIFGPMITTFAVVSWWEATRRVCTWNTPIGAWLLISPIFLDYASSTSIYLAIGTGIAVGVLSRIKGRTGKRYGGGWRALWRSNTLHEQEALARTPRHTDEMK